MQEKVKQFCYHELEMYKRWGGDIQQVITRCYGAIMLLLQLNPMKMSLMACVGGGIMKCILALEN